MSLTLVVDASPFGARAALIEPDEAVVAFGFADNDSVVDRLFLGRVLRVDPGLDALLLDIGLERPAMLRARDAAAADPETQGSLAQRFPEGRKLIVQGTRPPREGKGARVTADVRLVGFGLIHRPRHAGTGVSRRADASARGTLLERGRALLLDGFALRRRAADLDDAPLLAEAERLRMRWQAWEGAAGSGRPGPLPAGDDALALLLCAELGPEVGVLRATRLAMPATVAALATAPFTPRVDQEPDPERLDGLMRDALEPVVPLPNGLGRLVIERTRLGTTIDLDAPSAADPLEADLAAAAQVAREIRRRNLGGTVVVDFIDVRGECARRRVDRALKKALAADPEPVAALPMSRLGLVELSRPRRGASLSERLTLAPPVDAEGGPTRPAPAWQAERLWRALRTSERPVRLVRLERDLALWLDGSEPWRTALAGLRAPALQRLEVAGTAFEIERTDRAGRLETIRWGLHPCQIGP